MRLTRADKIALKKKFVYYKSRYNKGDNLAIKNFWMGHMRGLRSAVVLLDEKFVDKKLKIFEETS